MAEEPTLRTFVAVELAEEHHQWLAELLGALGRSFPGFRWTRPQNIHLTVRFLGRTPGSGVSRVLDAMGRALEGSRPCRIGIGPAGVFGPRRAPRVAWLGLRVGSDLDRLRMYRTRLEEALGEIGFEREGRDWTPHLTLGRNRARTSVEGWEEIVDSRIDGCPEIEITHWTLFSSDLTPRGPVYTVLGERPLGR